MCFISFIIDFIFILVLYLCDQEETNDKKNVAE